MRRQWTPPAQVELTIDEVVVHGVPVGDVEAFRAGLSGALRRLAAGWTGEPGPPPYPRPPLHVTTVDSAALGTQIAQAVWPAVRAGEAR